ncbi:hypothetical protein FISHEDRAFT_52255 [Fistulina hepatica ATCC 64428]|nr:hypothetical protein FISHEDRAFT_52255 [Fistulina hepatica ATCC 64428]
MQSSTSRPPNPRSDSQADDRSSLFRKSIYAIHDILSPFSPSALASLPNAERPARYLRTDRIPDPTEDDGEERNADRENEHRDYHAINSLPPQIRVPRKVPTPVRVEGKVWFANERTWLSWVNLSVLLGTLALALFNASRDAVARNFAYAYAVISCGVLIYGYVLYQHRLTKIRRRDPGHFDAIAGPVIISSLLFIAVLSNFWMRGVSLSCST